MKKNKMLLISLILSVIFSSVLTFLIYINTRQFESRSDSFLMTGILEKAFGPYIPLWLLGIISIICFVTLTVIFYLLLATLKKSKDT